MNRRGELGLIRLARQLVTHAAQVLDEFLLSSRTIKLGEVESSERSVVQVLLGRSGARVGRDGDLNGGLSGHD